MNEDNGALTESPLCHRRWHFSPSSESEPPRFSPVSTSRQALNSTPCNEQVLEPSQTTESEWGEKKKKIGVRCRRSTRSYPGRPDRGSLDSGSRLLRGSLAASSLLLMVKPRTSGRRRWPLRKRKKREKITEARERRRDEKQKTLLLQIIRSLFSFLPPPSP